MKLILFKNKASGCITAGQNRAEIRKRLQKPFEVFLKSAYSINTADSFPSLNIHCFYDEQDKLIAMEIFHPSKLHIENDDFNWLGKSNEEIIQFLSKKHPHLNDLIAVDSQGIFIEKYPLSTVVNEIGMTECCYIDFSSPISLEIYQDE